MLRAAFTLIELLVVVAIIAILAGMLLPALLSAREKSRRTTCMNQLKQFGNATESYCSDYGSYFPSYANWGVDPVLDPAAKFSIAYPTSQSVYVAASDAGSTVNLSATYFRTMAYGYGTNGHANGNLSCGPVGVGIVIASGYLNDVKAAACPSGLTMPPDPGVTPSDVTKSYWASGSESLRKLNATDAKDFLTSDFSALRWSADAEDTRGLQSAYSYRNVPTTTNESTSGEIPRYYLFTTVKPTLRVWPGAPQFKTQRLIVGRAVLSDTFSRTLADDPADKRTTGGMGKYAHKDGYNVLYADWHAQWYGDPQGTITEYARTDMEVGSDHANLDTRNTASDDSEIAPEDNMGFAVWHQFDTAGSIDK